MKHIGSQTEPQTAPRPKALSPVPQNSESWTPNPDPLDPCEELTSLVGSMFERMDEAWLDRSASRAASCLSVSPFKAALCLRSRSCCNHTRLGTTPSKPEAVQNAGPQWAAEQAGLFFATIPPPEATSPILLLLLPLLLLQ